MVIGVQNGLVPRTHLFPGAVSRCRPNGKLFPATVIDRPDKVAMMKQMAKMDMKMGAPALVGNSKKKTPEFLMQKYGMKMDMKDGQMKMNNNMSMDEGTMKKQMEMKDDKMDMDNTMEMKYIDIASAQQFV